MKKYFLIILLTGIFNASGQGFITEKGLNFSLSGFIKNDFILDSRKNAEAVDGLYTLWPLRPEYDENGSDLNAVPSARMFSISSRLTTRFSGLEIGSARVGATLELDFTRFYRWRCGQQCKVTACLHQFQLATHTIDLWPYLASYIC